LRAPGIAAEAREAALADVIGKVHTAIARNLPWTVRLGFQIVDREPRRQPGTCARFRRSRKGKVRAGRAATAGLARRAKP
jgi:hypothetical protein